MHMLNLLDTLFNPTFSFTIGDVQRVPLLFANIDTVNNIASKCLSISKQDWDSRETSWNFEVNTLIKNSLDSLKSSY